MPGPVNGNGLFGTSLQIHLVLRTRPLTAQDFLDNPHDMSGIAPHHEANPAQAIVRAESVVGTIPTIAPQATGILGGYGGVANDNRKAFNQDGHHLPLL